PNIRLLGESPVVVEHQQVRRFQYIDQGIPRAGQAAVERQFQNANRLRQLRPLPTVVGDDDSCQRILPENGGNESFQMSGTLEGRDSESDRIEHGLWPLQPAGVPERWKIGESTPSLIARIGAFKTRFREYSTGGRPARRRPAQPARAQT